VRAKEVVLFFNGLLHRNLVLNIFLRSIFDAHKSETQVDFLIHNHALRIGSSVHNVDLRNHTNRPDTLCVNLSSHPQSVGSGHIGVGWHNAKNNSARIAHVSHGHVTRDLFNIVRLACDGDKSDSGQINERQVRARVRIYIQHNGVIDNSFGGTSDFVSKSDDSFSDFLEVGELFAFHFDGELGPGFGSLGQVIQTEFKRASCHNAVSSWQKVETDN